MRFSSSLRAYLSAFLRLLRFFLVVLITYLLQACVVPYMAIQNIVPSLLLAVASVISVCYGKLRAYWIGALFGILTETMSPTVYRMNLLLYPILITFSSAFFADKSDKKLEEERSMNRRGVNIHPLIRTPLCGLMNSVLYSSVNTIYIYLGGTVLNVGHYTRALGFVIYTTLLTIAVMFPLRAILGFKVIPPRNKKVTRGRYLNQKLKV